jgi:cob(I)alamin adenosyltransferase
MKIYTKTGDTGKTSLAMGGRVLKSDLRVEMYGTCDELNSTIGLVLSYTSKDNFLVPYLNMTQNLLFEIGSELSGFKPKNSETSAIVMEDIEYLEKAIDEIEEKIEPLKSFILPGGDKLASFLHVTRTVCRRLERLMVHAHSNGVEVLSNTLMYINRLSDFLFVAARYANFESGIQEPKWTSRVK